MNDFVLEKAEQGTVVLTLDRSVSLPRIFFPLIAGCIAVAVTVIIMPSAVQAAYHLTNAASIVSAGLQGLVCLCFAIVALLSFVQSLVGICGKQAWFATPGRLEYRQELFGWRYAAKVRGNTILLVPPGNLSPFYKLVVARGGDVEALAKPRNIHISSNDIELREVGNLLAGTTGWEFVEKAA
jgi:hypothetical protein